MDDTIEPHIESFAHQGAAPTEVVVMQSSLGAVMALDGANGESLWRWATRDRMASVAHGGEQVLVSAAASPYLSSVMVDDPPPGGRPTAGADRASPLLVHVPYIKVRLMAVTGVRASDGRILWRITVYCGGDIVPIYAVGDALIMSVISFQSKAQELIALDVATGALRWSHKIGPFGQLGGGFPLAGYWVTDGKVAVLRRTLASDGNDAALALDLLDPATGALIGHGDPPSPNDPPAGKQCSAGGVTFHLDYQQKWPHMFLRATNSDGADLWRVAYEDQSVAWIELCADEERLYLLSAIRRSERRIRVDALDAATGRAAWRWRSPLWLVALALVRQALQRIQEAKRAGTWREFWSDALRLRWRHPIRPANAPEMRLTYGRLYVATYLGAFALRVRDGHRLWHALPFTALNRVHVPPTAAQS